MTACLPERFEVDGDGRKAAWRAAFLQRVQGLVAQVGVRQGGVRVSYALEREGMGSGIGKCAEGRGVLICCLP